MASIHGKVNETSILWFCLPNVWVRLATVGRDWMPCGNGKIPKPENAVYRLFLLEDFVIGFIQFVV